MQDADFVMRTDPGLFYERSDLCVWVAGLQSENVGEQLPRSGPSESANLRRKSGVSRNASPGISAQETSLQAPAADGAARTITSPTVATSNVIPAEDVSQQVTQLERVRRLSRAGCAASPNHWPKYQGFTFTAGEYKDIIGNYYRGLAPGDVGFVIEFGGVCYQDTYPMYRACIVHVSRMYLDVSRSYTSRYIKIHRDTFVS